MDKQIEEMARTICGQHNNGCCEIDGYVCNYKCTSYEESEKIYEAGYRKIPENAVVLTDKKDIQQYEWSKLVDKMGVIEFGEKICKETAEKFAEMLKKLVAERNCNEDYDWEDVQIDGQIFVECIDEIAKKIAEGKSNDENGD